MGQFRSWMLFCPALFLLLPELAHPQTPPPAPSVVDPNLSVTQVVGNVSTPISLAFTGPGEFLLLEKNSGKVLRVVNGAIAGAVLDLAVNFGSERGLLGITLHPDFPVNPRVYLYWTCRAAAGTSDANRPLRCTEVPETSPQSDTDVLTNVPVLGNRVDSFLWQSGALVFEKNLVMLRAYQNDPTLDPFGQPQPVRGNHDGGVITFGPDRKLYIVIGDQGRRGQLQNLQYGPKALPVPPAVPDDQFGGPEPDDAHLTGVVLRLNDDGSTPADNPFFAYSASSNPQVNANIHKIFSYGVRNTFGMAFDPLSGNLWMEENGEDAFDELNRVEAGMNSGWIQIAGPASRVPQYRQIETTSLHGETFPNLQQYRWPPEFIAGTPAEALSRLFVLPGSRYKDPEFSWKYVIAPAGLGFMPGRGLGPQYEGDLFMGLAVPLPMGGPLLHFNLTGNRQKIGVDDPRLEDRVADNLTFNDLTESEELVFGRNFGVVTDIESGPDNSLYIVSISRGAVYRISRNR